MHAFLLRRIIHRSAYAKIKAFERFDFYGLDRRWTDGFPHCVESVNLAVECVRELFILKNFC